MSNKRAPGPNTRAVHGGQRLDPSTGAVIPPIYATSTYAQSAPGVHQGYEIDMLWYFLRTERPIGLSRHRIDISNSAFQGQ